MDSIQLVTPDTLFPQRKRAFKPKTKTGCQTCRTRRIKCDELRPACTQCTRGRRVCDGYVAVTKTKVAQPDTLTPKRSRVQIAPSLISNMFKSASERKYYDFFLHRTTLGLSGPFKSEFWSRLVLQATHHELAIRHAIVAIGALHEAFEKSRDPGGDPFWQDNAFALQHYLKAIRYLVKPVDAQSDCQVANVALLTCVLFVCLEVLRGYHGAALAHIEGGIRLFNQIRQTGSTKSSNGYAPMWMFNHIFVRLDNQASSITYKRPRNLLSTPLPNLCFPAEPFQNLNDARMALDKIQNAVVRESSSIIDPTLIINYAKSEDIQIGMCLSRGQSMQRLDQWAANLNRFEMKHKDDLGADGRKAIEVMQILRTVMAINFSIDFVAVTKNEMLWDEHLSGFMEIVEYARKFAEHGIGEENVPTFTLETEIILPLYFVAAKCRDGQLRRQAISLLKLRERQEGIWNSILTARLSERLMQMEEQGHGGANGYCKMEDVRWEQRVKGVQVKWDLEQRRVKLTYQCVEVVDGGRGEVVVCGPVPRGSDR